MVKLVPFILFFVCACFLAYVKEIDRLERDEEPARSGKRFLLVTFGALGLSVLFTLWSADAGLILLTLTLYLVCVLAGVAAGQWLALLICRRRSPDYVDDEE